MRILTLTESDYKYIKSTLDFNKLIYKENNK